MKKILILLITAVLAVSCSAAFAADAPALAPLLDTRQTDIWVEGQRLGDLVLGARGTMQFIYVDEKLSKAISANNQLENWVMQMAQYYGTDEAKGKALFITHLSTYKPWDFDPGKVHVGDYYLTKNDILSPSMTNPFGPIASKDEGYFAFVVPASLLKTGKELNIGYGDDTETWKVPK